MMADQCRRCTDLMNNAFRPYKFHSDECRLRIYLSWKDAGDSKFEDVRHFVEPDSPITEAKDMDLDPSHFDGRSGIETPRSAPPDPAQASSDRWDPSGYRSAWSDVEVEIPDHENPDMDMFFPDEFDAPDDSHLTDQGPYDLADVSATDMVDALIMAGTDSKAAKLFTHAVVNATFPSSFMEVYGRGEIVKDADGPRRALNIEGLGAVDIGIFKPNGDS